MGAWVEHERLGYNYRMDEMSAALGLSQLARLDEILEKREFWSKEKRPQVDTFLEQRREDARREGEQRQEQRAEESLAIAREANKLSQGANDFSAEANKTSKRANLIAWIALAVAGLGLVVAIAALVFHFSSSP